MNKYKCPICSYNWIGSNSESGKAGACYRCRDNLIPNHVPKQQHKLYLKLYLKEKI
jgi:hypothetical protein